MKRFKLDDRVRVEGESEEGYVIGAVDNTGVVVAWEQKGTKIARTKRAALHDVTLVTPNPRWPLDEREEYP